MPYVQGLFFKASKTEFEKMIIHIKQGVCSAMQEYIIFKGRSTTKINDRDEESYPSIARCHYEPQLPWNIIHGKAALIKVIGVKMKIHN